MPKKEKKKAWELGVETNHAKRLKGICAMQKNLLDTHSINLAKLPRGDGSRQAALAIPGLATSLVIAKDDKLPLPAHQQREARKTGRAPLRPPKVQARPTARTWRWIDKVAVAVPRAVPGIRRALGEVSIAVAPAGEPLAREMEDWSAEYATLQVKQAGGRVHVIAPPTPEPEPPASSPYPHESARRHDLGISHEYGLYGTAWNKVTLGINCPTTLHYDDKNVGLTALLIVGMYGLEGGAHALFGIDKQDLVVVKECEAGTLILGDYKRCLHGNFATVAGLRFVINAYCSKAVVDRITP